MLTKKNQMVPPAATSLPGICSLDPAEIEALPLTFNECLRSSHKQNGYHVFTLLFRIQFYKLDSAVQEEALKGIIVQQQRSWPLSLSSS